MTEVSDSYIAQVAVKLDKLERERAQILERLAAVEALARDQLIAAEHQFRSLANERFSHEEEGILYKIDQAWSMAKAADVSANKAISYIKHDLAEQVKDDLSKQRSRITLMEKKVEDGLQKLKDTRILVTLAIAASVIAISYYKFG